jgi:hypothetical protein
LRSVSRDFFEAVPKGSNVYVMKRVTHDWDNESCAKILANCRTAMGEMGRVLVVDRVIALGNDPDRGKAIHTQMLIMRGRERTKQELAKLFREGGLKLIRVVAAKCPLSIVERART